MSYYEVEIKMDYNKYANEILYDFIMPQLMIFYKNDSIDIVLNEDNISEDNIDYTGSFIFTVYHDEDAFSPEKKVADYFRILVDNHDISKSIFLLTYSAQNLLDKQYYFAYSNSYADSDNEFVLTTVSKYSPLKSIDDIVKVIEILKKNMLKLYSKFAVVNIYTKKEYQLYKVSKLYEKINEIKAKNNFSDEDLNSAKAIANSKLNTKQELVINKR